MLDRLMYEGNTALRMSPIDRKPTIFPRGSSTGRPLTPIVSSPRLAVAQDRPPP